VVNEVWCVHSHPPEGDLDLSPQTHVAGVVVCVHPYGLGVHLADKQTFGHVDAPMMGVLSAHGLDDYPSVGSTLNLEVLGYSGSGQLRLRVVT
jgi:hypothetical protein